MHEDEQAIIDAQAEHEQAATRRRQAIETALRNRSVKQDRIAEITGVSRETIRVIRKEAGIPADPRYVRKVGK